MVQLINKQNASIVRGVIMNTVTVRKGIRIPKKLIQYAVCLTVTTVASLVLLSATA